jgi:hypothetical protein
MVVGAVDPVDCDGVISLHRRGIWCGGVGSASSMAWRLDPARRATADYDDG